MATVKVVVRVRPFNQRELNLDCGRIISMDGKKTTIVNKKIKSTQEGDNNRERVKEFVFDHSYWSFDSGDPDFVSQETVFSDLGAAVVDSAYEGYNACVFAYGQTGSGKTYTMMGTPDSVGLIPRICEALFARMQTGKEDGTTYRVEVSYLEIYNEHVKDLLRKGSTSHNLRVREHPKQGPYVQDLSKHLVMEYCDIQELMLRGNAHRTTAATNMNDISSRSHAIFTLMFVQAKFSQDMPSETVSKIHLVDLAGSERADASGATGQRLKEGGHINKSLVTLGSVISSLAELSTSAAQRGKNVFIPYRDSVLTWLLKDSLGGNSKTVMIAAISPADVNYGETLSTLRYANRAKNIVNKPTVNEDPNVKLIRELKAEIAKLKNMLSDSQTMLNSTSMVEKLQENEAKVKLLTEEWEGRWRVTKTILQEQRALALRKEGLGVVLDSDRPHLVGIDDNVLSTGITLYPLNDGQTCIGSEESEKKQDIILSGNGIHPEHCIIDLKNGMATLIPMKDAECVVNTIQIDSPTRLSQGCVIRLGRMNMFRYNDPAEAAELRKENQRVSRLNLSFLSCSLPDLAGPSESAGYGRANLETHLEGISSKHPASESNFYLRESSRPGSIPTRGYGTDGCMESSKNEDGLPLEHCPPDLGEEESLHRLCGERNDIPVGYPNNDLLDRHIQELCRLNDDRLKEARQLTDSELIASAAGEQPTNDFIAAILHDRITELVEQEVQRRLVEEMAERLHQIREQQEELLRVQFSRCTSGVSLQNYRSLSMGSLGYFPGQCPILQTFSIVIPSYIQRGVGYSSHYEFEVRVTTCDDTWSVFRRYSRFLDLHTWLKNKYGSPIANIPFPSKSVFGAKTETRLKNRQRYLERYLQLVIDKCLELPKCPLSSLTYDTLTRVHLVQELPFLKKGVFEASKHSTG